MIRYLFILLLLPFISNAQRPSINPSSPSSGNNCGGAGSISYTPYNWLAGYVHLVVIFIDSSANYESSISATGQTFDLITQFGNGSRKTSVYRTSCTSSHNDNLTVGFTGFNTGAVVQVVDCGGALTSNNGADAIRQYKIDSGTLANPSITMAALTSASSVVTFWQRAQDSFTGTPESGWTEHRDNGCTSGSYVNGYYTMYKVNAVGDNTPTVTASNNVPWQGIAIEIVGNGRIYNVH